MLLAYQAEARVPRDPGAAGSPGGAFSGPGRLAVAGPRGAGAMGIVCPGGDGPPAPVFEGEPYQRIQPVRVGLPRVRDPGAGACPGAGQVRGVSSL